MEGILYEQRVDGEETICSLVKLGLGETMSCGGIPNWTCILKMQSHHCQEQLQWNCLAKIQNYRLLQQILLNDLHEISSSVELTNCEVKHSQQGTTR